ncbi:MAG: LysM peptidoglycan-binding domain-containing protein [Chloroflexota bacterium]
MRQQRLITIAAMLIFAFALPAQAQDNLLTNGGLEEGEFGPYQGAGRGTLNIPAGWSIWLAYGDTGQYYNRGDEVYAFPSRGPEPTPIEGQAIANIHAGYVTFTAALYQTIDVAPGTNLTATASSYLIACTLDDDDEFGKCASDPASGAQTRIGIDPDGGNDPNAPEVVWSSWEQAHNYWGQMQVQATATGGTATLFLYMTQATVNQFNYAYWDNAILSIGGEGGAALIAEATPAADTGTTVVTLPPTATPRPRLQYAPFVVPQSNTMAESVEPVIHVVRQGDTFDAIAYAYGLTRDELLEMNPELPSMRFLRVGQRIIVQPGSTAGVAATEEATEEPAATPTG